MNKKIYIIIIMLIGAVCLSGLTACEKETEDTVEVIETPAEVSSLADYSFLDEEAESIVIVFDNDRAFLSIFLQSGHHDSEMEKIMEMLQSGLDGQKTAMEEPQANALLITIDGWMYSFSFDDEYVTYTGEPLSSELSTSFYEREGMANAELIEYLNAMIESGKYDVVEMEKTYQTDKSMEEILHEMADSQLVETSFYWSYFQQLNDRVADIADNGELDNGGYFSEELTQDNIEYIMNTLMNTEYEVLEEGVETSTEFHIAFVFDDSSRIALNLNDSDVYISLFYDGEWQYLAKVLDENLYDYIIKLADEENEKFDMHTVVDTESITIYYVKDEDLKDFLETFRISKIEIEDAETIKQIVNSVLEYAEPSGIYTPLDSSDIVFHTPDGDVYAKIKYPVNEDSQTEPIIIMEGYYWYSCEELYEILSGIEQ